VTEVEYLDLEDLLALVRLLDAGPVRDIGLLDSAAARARATAFGRDACPTVELKAAALVHSAFELIMRAAEGSADVPDIAASLGG
jgi:death on curing protein